MTLVKGQTRRARNPPWKMCAESRRGIKSLATSSPCGVDQRELRGATCSSPFNCGHPMNRVRRVRPTHLDVRLFIAGSMGRESPLGSKMCVDGRIDPKASVGQPTRRATFCSEHVQQMVVMERACPFTLSCGGLRGLIVAAERASEGGDITQLLRVLVR